MNTNYKQVITYLKNFYHNHIRYSCHYTTIEKIGIRQDIDYVIEIIQKRMQGDNEWLTNNTKNTFIQKSYI